jgi:predicted oxidoreductase
MSGGTDEYVMGNYNKTAGKSGLTVSGVPAEHIDIYSGTSVSASHLGDATGETAGWYSDYAFFVLSSVPWFERGGYYSNGDVAGVFVFDVNTGEGSTFSGFRVALSTTGA